MLPYISKRITSIDPVFSFEEDSQVAVSRSLSNYLTRLKNSIDEVQVDWDVYKRYTNPYECLHSQSFGQVSQPVCPIRPISRSYFKMIEICHTFDIISSMPDTMRSFHIAEGPGGFIEALSQLRKNPADAYVGMTLMSDSPTVPGWRKSQAFLEKNPNVFIETGADGTGDITREPNLLHCSGKYGATMDLVTADGGFDFSGDFNHQENQVGLLLVSQLAMATAVQKKGGTLIMKLFDVFTKLSLDIVYLLTLMYDKVSIVKPNTSRYANSERYVVAQGFKSPDGRLDWTIQFAPILERIPKQKITERSSQDEGGDGENQSDAYRYANILSLVNDDIPRILLTKIEESNASIGQQQMDNISSTLTLIKNPRQEKMERMRISSIQRCVVWCQKHDLPYNRDVRHFNMFLSAKNKVSRAPRKKYSGHSSEQDDDTLVATKETRIENESENANESENQDQDQIFGCDLPVELNVLYDVDQTNAEEQQHVKEICEQMVKSVVDES